MSASSRQADEEVRLYADSCNGRFVIEHDRQRWTKVFASLPDAIRFVTHMPRTGSLKIVLVDEVGHFLTELFLRPC